METGYDFRNARSSSADAVRFNSPDIFEAIFPTVTPYNYVVGNPIVNMDPMGLDTMKTYVLGPVLITAQRIWKNSESLREKWGSIKLPATDLDTDLAEFRTQVYTTPLLDINWHRTETVLTNVEKGQYVTTKGLVKAIPKKMTKQATEYVNAAKGLKVLGNITQGLGMLNMYNDYAGYHNGTISGKRYAVKLAIDMIGFLPPPFPLISLGLSVVEYAIGDMVEKAVDKNIEEGGAFYRASQLFDY